MEDYKAKEFFCMIHNWLFIIFESKVSYYLSPFFFPVFFKKEIKALAAGLLLFVASLQHNDIVGILI